MFDTLSIRLKIVLLSGLCLLGVIALIISINLYETDQNDHLISDSSSRMLTSSVQNLLQAKAAEQAVQLQKTFGENLLVVTALADQIKDLRNLAAKRSLDRRAARRTQPEPENHFRTQQQGARRLVVVRAQWLGWQGQRIHRRQGSRVQRKRPLFQLLEPCRR